jgi:hypothetical protein
MNIHQWRRHIQCRAYHARAQCAHIGNHTLQRVIWSAQRKVVYLDFGGIPNRERTQQMDLDLAPEAVEAMAQLIAEAREQERQAAAAAEDERQAEMRKVFADMHQRLEGFRQAGAGDYTLTHLCYRAEAIEAGFPPPPAEDGSGSEDKEEEDDDSEEDT